MKRFSANEEISLSPGFCFLKTGKPTLKRGKLKIENLLILVFNHDLGKDSPNKDLGDFWINCLNWDLWDYWD